MSELSTVMLIKALDGLSARALATSQNIANAQSPGYRPVRVRFEAALAAAASRGTAAVEAVQPRMEAEPTGPDAEVRLDQEMATAASTELRYAALIDLLNRQLQLRSLALSGSR
ncbi:MAG TPA: hypothetical protein VIO94_13480 [Phenylobacterium sp.]